LFYEPGYYLANPQDIIAVWKGGMSFHGALVGCIVAIWAFARRNGVNAWSAMDVCAAAVPIGLFFGRIANFINGELFGRPTTVPWGMVFPEAALHYPSVEPTPRHPSQLYEAMLEGLILFLVLRLLTHKYGALKRPGVVGGTFLIGYALARSISEWFREPHFAHAFNVGPFTAGIVYSIPMLIVGAVLVYFASTRSLR
jgi:phosphatidylglycerol:prolipoprotein diacylglycerol transferase